MRIGVNTGTISSGLLGLYKWQFDIFGNAVAIANRLEQSGEPG